MFLRAIIPNIYIYIYIYYCRLFGNGKVLLYKVWENSQTFCLVNEKYIRKPKGLNRSLNVILLSFVEMSFAYRLLNNKDNPDKGLSAKDPDGHTSLLDHVAYGSNRGQISKYISASATFEAVSRFANRTSGRIRIVKIDL